MGPNGRPSYSAADRRRGLPGTHRPYTPTRSVDRDSAIVPVWHIGTVSRRPTSDSRVRDDRRQEVGRVDDWTVTVFGLPGLQLHPPLSYTAFTRTSYTSFTDRPLEADSIAIDRTGHDLHSGRVRIALDRLDGLRNAKICATRSKDSCGRN